MSLNYLRLMSLNSSLCLKKVYLTSENHICQNLIKRFCPQIQLAEITSEKHNAHEHLKTSVDQHQRALSIYQQKVAALQEECRAAKVCSPLGSTSLEGCGLAFQCLLSFKNTYQMNTRFSSSDPNPNTITTLSHG